ncbi:MAG: cofactor-independent phosphoglycerate mutase [Nitrospirae bacterium GWC2_46_6]|nr:MAG: cofactor-independent phosphoglycerate mutase [Nitrospirae bacterium GWC2_46_6]OGW19951.1 MAG: cofactor-independent phosphoglycerate mutase [Nitrospirae bacterium GWA2_46_11]OGW25540.1 MAG: cofactor-independent phosphoglycerate mutase [Nitrospirae bacterium GWB2_47_37]HAK89106.1 cofactor-independent phosphoglycerate mutase [Nitrospiraceae bacterium]HCZ12607.1 cofactor-independent phosphoglycerate mutase [Nitrospiraceae bacterium]
MKYIVIIGDGMADRPLDELGGLTPLQKASAPNMDELARNGIIGSVRTIPEGFHPGSDVANLSILGYDPARYYTGRAPLEAASIGVKLDETDVAYRCNLVTLKFDKNKTHAIMDDYSSGHITTEEAIELIKSVKAGLENDEIVFYPGVSYRHLMVWKNGSVEVECAPPHDILDKDIADYLPVGERDGVLRELMRKSVDILEGHPVNKERLKNGKKSANSIWLWGQGKKPRIPAYQEKYGLKGALISAVDLTKGLGINAGFEILKVPGVTGWLDTNYSGKAEYALNALENADFVYIHVESPDEAGHSGNYESKIKAIEDFDSLVVGPVMKGLKERFKDYRVLLMPDHATPIKVRTHTDEPVPFVIYDSRSEKNNKGATYDESITERNDIVVINEGHKLMDYFIREAAV